MSIVFVAQSKQVALWGTDVGLGKNIYLLSVAEDDVAAGQFLKSGPCGAEDWLLLKQEQVEQADEAALQEKLAKKEKRIDPLFYPRLRGFAGLFKVKSENVENHLLVKRALDGMDSAQLKIKPADIAAYLLLNALK
jgi:hypothetical protein